MKNLARRAYRFTNGRLSADRKQSLKIVAKQVLPRRVRRQLRRAAARMQPEKAAERREAKRRQAKHDRVLDRKVSSLSRALWMGFTQDALAELESLRRGEDAHRPPIARAAETLARWYATQGQDELALERLIHARAINGLSQSERLRVFEHHLLTRLGRLDEADQLFQKWGEESPDLRLVQANLLLRRADDGELAPDEAGRERLALIDWIFDRHGLTPVSTLLQDPTNLAYAGLRTEPAPVEGEPEPPVVSIVVPAYNAETTLTNSVDSLRAQTLRAVEILIVDDSSSDNTYAVAKTLAAADPRVKVFQHPQNLGAYAARNTGLAHATGEYFTVHDADDWSHPQLLERQLEALRTQADAVGSFSRLARVSPRLEFLLRTYRPMLEPIHWNYMSLLCRTQVYRDLGGWDTVRAHADSEFIERLRAHHGADVLVEVDTTVPLSFCLVTGDNITENKATGMRSIDFGSRREYMEQARFWRSRTFAEGELPSLAGHRRTGLKDPFFSTRPMLSGADAAGQAYDVVIGSDLALLGGTRRCNLAYIDCARKLGLRVGLFNAPRYRTRGFGSVDAAYRELLELDGVDLLTPEDDVTAKALLLHHPPVLRRTFDGYPTIDAEHRFLLVNQLPWQMKNYTDVQYDTSAIHQRFTDAFGGEPNWISISPRVRRYLDGELAPGVLLDEDWFPIVSWAGPSPRTRTVGTAPTPVVGRQSRDHATKWPEDAGTLAQAYLAGTQYKVQLLGGTAAAEAVLGHRPENWVVHPFDSLSVTEFLDGIDIFVHFHHSNYIEEFGRNIAEAMAVGVPCVLPPEYAEIFGDAAVYAEPADVERTVAELWADGERYADYSRRGAAFVAENCGSEVGMRRISSLLA
ncbi:glycosyltransferase family 2 protein [Jiangella anatolica]|uniref:Glycosyltransferase 2-like domain-containing protein n=1 Tax=Jiangella anatolica TaxID=2670374 RepID=A0A2W2B2V6_9ACTN|nr:glycosyltransferase family 2 protein [Jiangella anatolica]PZF81761.1 hypothetical protein C1I92_19635 [Jiangella anatolica]